MEIPMKQLVDYLNQKTKEYDEGHPSISDAEWDREYFKLQRMEQEKGYALPESPTQKITYEVKNSLEKVEHGHFMSSAAKTKDWDEFINYFGEKDVTGMLKLDGLTCSLTYAGGRLVAAETRGDGHIGEDILHNARVMSSIPKLIDYTDDLVIDGEIICTYENFEPFSEEYKNPRNFAAGSIRLLDSKECARRNLTFVAWNVVTGLGDILLDNFNKLQQLGFTVVPWTSSFDLDAKDFLVEQAEWLGYPIDGLIGRFTSRQYGESLGSTDHHSKALYAFKFVDEEYETELVDIEWTMGRTGVLTPVAVYKDIDIDGATCNRASLHNVSVMRETLGDHPFVGQKIKVYKANSIIPQINWAEEWPGDIPIFAIPIVCPVCGGVATLEESSSGTVNLVCINPSCDGKISKKMEHYCSRDKGMDIRGLSLKTIEKLLDWGYINEIKDIYTLSRYKKEWSRQSGFGEKSVTNILDSIETSRHTTLEQFISSLGIPLIGRAVAKEISKTYATWNDFRSAIGERWSDLEGFGPEMERALNSFDYAEADLIAAEYLVFEAETPVDTARTEAAAGLTFCITGKLSRKRDDIKADIEAAGGKVTGSVSSKTSYLVCNDKTSTTGKSADAKRYNIPVITEEELMEIIK